MQLIKTLECVDMFTQFMSKAKEKKEKVDKHKFGELTFNHQLSNPNDHRDSNNDNDKNTF